MPVEVTWDQCTQLISPGGAFSGTADAGGFIEGGEQARLMETCIGEGQVAADTDIDDKKSRRTKNNGTGKGDSLPKPNAASGGNERDKDTSGATVATKSTAVETVGLSGVSSQVAWWALFAQSMPSQQSSSMAQLLHGAENENRFL